MLLSDAQIRSRQKIVDILSKDATFDRTYISDLSRKESILRGLRVSKRLLELRDRYRWDTDDYHLAMSLQDDSLPTSLHESAFMAVIKAQGNDSQIAEWIPKAFSYEIIGCYAQTELSHGSNVQGLGTTATYDSQRRQFVVHTPALEHTKWWSGGLGCLATHCVVQAQLIVTGCSHGPHLFIVPVRSLETHKPLPGIFVGDIGAKAYGGFGSIDNGYVKFSHVHIPERNMLARFARIDNQKYIRAKHDKLSYGSMVALRAGIPLALGWDVAKAVTIALRYCSRRRQFGGLPGNEKAVLDYQAVQYRLFPILADAFAFIISGQALHQLFHRMQNSLLTKGDTSLLAEVHSYSSALKVKISTAACNDIEEARKTIGGHGYSAHSGISRLFANAVPSQTYEGDNYVIAQQTARALIKHLTNLSTDERYALPTSAEYLSLLSFSEGLAQAHPLPETPEDWFESKAYIATFDFRAARLVSDLMAHFKDKTEDLSQYSWQTASVAKAHAERCIVHTFLEKVGSMQDIRQRKVLEKVLHLHALNTLVNCLPDLYADGYFLPKHGKTLRKALEIAIQRISPLALDLTQEFHFSEWELSTALGGRGDPYEALFQRAVNDPINQPDAAIEEAIRNILTHTSRSKVKL